MVISPTKILLLGLLISSVLTACTRLPTHKDTKPAHSVRFGDTSNADPRLPSDQEIGGCFDSDCTTQISGTTYRLFYQPSQNIYEVQKATETLGFIQLTPSPSHEVERLYLIGHHDQLIVAFEAGDQEEIQSELISFDPDTLLQKWRLSMPGFNLNRPYKMGSALFTSVLGFVGKVDLETGNWIWKHDRLYESKEFKGATSVTVSEGVVSFQGESTRLRIHNQTGELL